MGTDDKTGAAAPSSTPPPAPVRRTRSERMRLARERAGRPPAACSDPASTGLRRGIEQFNQREYFECHETLEHLWNEEPGPARTLYKGILQVGVGCYHLLRHNYHGATVKLQSGADYLEPFVPRCMGVDVARLIADARFLRAALITLGPERFMEVDLALLPRIVVVNGAADR
jgi:hypothetical protein